MEERLNRTLSEKERLEQLAQQSDTQLQQAASERVSSEAATKRQAEEPFCVGGNTMILAVASWRLRSRKPSGEEKDQGGMHKPRWWETIIPCPC